MGKYKAIQIAPIDLSDNDIAVAVVKERVIDIFEDEILRRPELAGRAGIYLQTMLDYGKKLTNRFYAHTAVPFLQTLEITYSGLTPDFKKAPLKYTTDFLSNIEVHIAQAIVKELDRPEFISDVCINCPEAHPTKAYNFKRLNWSHFEEAYFEGDEEAKYIVESPFWIMRTALKKTTPEAVRRNLSEIFPELKDKTLNGIAAIIDTESRRRALTPAEYSRQVANRMRPYHLVNHEDIREKIDKRDWTLLETTAEKLTFRD